MSRWAVTGVVLAACAEPAPPAVDPYPAPPPPEPGLVDVVMPGLMIDPGAEVMACYHTDELPPGLIFDKVVGVQQPGAHHLGIKATTAPRPDGTFEDCTTGAANQALHELHYGGNLPAGAAMHLPPGQLVLQLHYVNTTDGPLAVRDVARFRRATPTADTRWLSALQLKADTVTVGPGPQSLQFTCTATRAAALAMVWGHMHGSGRRFTLEHLPVAGPPSTLYAVDDWQAAFTNGPPRTDFGATPYPIAAGDRLRVTCAWDNPGATPLAYPNEMCGASGYVLGDVPLWCEQGTIVEPR